MNEPGDDIWQDLERLLRTGFSVGAQSAEMLRRRQADALRDQRDATMAERQAAKDSERAIIEKARQHYNRVGWSDWQDRAQLNDWAEAYRYSRQMRDLDPLAVTAHNRIEAEVHRRYGIDIRTALDEHLQQSVERQRERAENDLAAAVDESRDQANAAGRQRGSATAAAGAKGPGGTRLRTDRPAAATHIGDRADQANETVSEEQSPPERGRDASAGPQIHEGPVAPPASGRPLSSVSEEEKTEIRRQFQGLHPWEQMPDGRSVGTLLQEPAALFGLSPAEYADYVDPRSLPVFYEQQLMKERGIVDDTGAWMHNAEWQMDNLVGRLNEEDRQRGHPRQIPLAERKSFEPREYSEWLLEKANPEAQRVGMNAATYLDHLEPGHIEQIDHAARSIDNGHNLDSYGGLGRLADYRTRYAEESAKQGRPVGTHRKETNERHIDEAIVDGIVLIDADRSRRPTTSQDQQHENQQQRPAGAAEDIVIEGEVIVSPQEASEAERVAAQTAPAFGQKASDAVSQSRGRTVRPAPIRQRPSARTQQRSGRW